MRRVASALLIALFLSLGSGALESLHNAAHAMEDAAEDATEAAFFKATGHPVLPHQHDESNCDIHAQLHMALFLTSWVPLLVLLGLWVAFLSLFPHSLIPRHLPARIDCRGPPSLLCA